MVNKTKNNEKVEFSRKTDFSRNPKKCVFRNITTHFENRLKLKFISFLSLFGLRPTSAYSTEQCQFILQPVISVHFAHFRFRREFLSSNDTTFVRVILFSKMLPKTINYDHKSLNI